MDLQYMDILVDSPCGDNFNEVLMTANFTDDNTAATCGDCDEHKLCCIPPIAQGGIHIKCSSAKEIAAPPRISDSSNKTQIHSTRYDLYLNHIDENLTSSMSDIYSGINSPGCSTAANSVDLIPLQNVTTDPTNALATVLQQTNVNPAPSEKHNLSRDCASKNGNTRNITDTLPGRGSPTTPLPPCKICGDKSSGVHFGAVTCQACKVRTLYVMNNSFFTV